MILIADSNTVYGVGLSTILSDTFPLKIEFDPNSQLSQIKQKLQSGQFQIVITGSYIGDTHFSEFILELKSIHRATQVLLIPEFIQAANVKKYFSEFLIDGILLNTCSAEQLVEAVRAMVQGEIYIDPSLRFTTSKSEMVEQIKGNDPFYLINKLTPRELEIMHDIIKGFTSKKIAEKLYLSEETVKTHRKNLMKKLGVNNTFEIMAFLDSIQYQSN